MTFITVTESPWPADYEVEDDAPPWVFEDSDFIDWVDEVFLEGYKQDNEPMCLGEAIDTIESQGYKVMIGNVKVFLDDQWDDQEMPARHPPEGFVPSKSVLEVANWVLQNQVSFISFDHDLGLPFDGGTLAKCIEKWAAEGRIAPIKWEIHSANPVGRDRIEKAMKSAERFWSKK